MDDLIDDLFKYIKELPESNLKNCEIKISCSRTNNGITIMCGCNYDIKVCDVLKIMAMSIVKTTGKSFLSVPKEERTDIANIIKIISGLKLSEIGAVQIKSSGINNNLHNINPN